MAEYVKVASLSEVAVGGSKIVEVSGKLIALFNVNGQVFAIDNTCRHQGGPLGEGVLEGNIVTCPWHMWEYDVSTGEHTGNPSIKVGTYPVQIEGTDIKIAV